MLAMYMVISNQFGSERSRRFVRDLDSLSAEADSVSTILGDVSCCWVTFGVGSKIV